MFVFIRCNLGVYIRSYICPCTCSCISTRISRLQLPPNPCFQTVTLPGSPGYALYPSAQEPLSKAIRRIRQNDGLETGITGATAARLFSVEDSVVMIRSPVTRCCAQHRWIERVVRARRPTAWRPSVLLCDASTCFVWSVAPRARVLNTGVRDLKNTARAIKYTFYVLKYVRVHYLYSKH